MPRAVRFDRYGDLDQLHLADVRSRPPKTGEVVVRVRAAGVNPGEVAILRGDMDADFPATFPSGQGTEFAGVIVELGDQVGGVDIGDGVIGFSDTRDAQADEVVLPTSNVLLKPEGVDWDVAAIIPISGATATSMIRAAQPQPGETVVVSGAGGGVGFIAAQLLRLAQANVIGIAGEADHDSLRAIGVLPVAYGEGVEGRVRKIAPNGIDAFLDTNGRGQADLAVALGVAPDRVDSIIDFEAGQRLGIKTEGMYQLDDIRAAVIEVAGLVASGSIEMPVRARYPLEHVVEAYRALDTVPGVGRIVLEISADDAAATRP